MLTPGNLKNMIFTFEIRSPKTVENIPKIIIKRIFSINCFSKNIFLQITKKS